MVCIGIWGWVLMVKDPVVRDDTGVELAHETLSNVVDTVLI
jgi:hypothetical protein